MNENPDKRRNGNVSAVVTDGRRIDFLGYCFTHERVRLRKSIKQTFARKEKKIRTAKRRRETRASYWGWCKWGNCRHLWKKITNNDMSFSEIGITGRSTTKDGQRFFDIRKVRAMEILNVPITVIDFEPNIKTSNGGGRYAVKIIFENQEAKFITNSFTLKSQLDQAKERNVLPIQTKLKKRDIGDGMTDYIFD
ncbi:MAG: hypothetical protein NC131_21890 [Roseburia sp.]|nr:hypothetical protein [Bacteroides sp.]MCM1441837.1 hypothetical protein [Roseburia sp.]